jgi:uridine nucleosidase
MGGAIGSNFTSAPMGTIAKKERIGNWSPYAEFNILVDPEAAAFIFDHPILNKKTTLIPLDVTHMVLADKEVQTLLLNGKDGLQKTTLRTMLCELLVFFAETYRDVFGITTGPPLHDPLAVATILDGLEGMEIPFYDYAEKGKRERYQVHVVTDGSHEEAQAGEKETGRTIVKLMPEGEEGVKIPRGLDVKRFWTVLEECLEGADEANKANGVV